MCLRKNVQHVIDRENFFDSEVSKRLFHEIHFSSVQEAVCVLGSANSGQHSSTDVQSRKLDHSHSLQPLSTDGGQINTPNSRQVANESELIRVHLQSLSSFIK